MGATSTKIVTATVIACALGMVSPGPAFAGGAGAQDSRGPERPPRGGGGQHNGAGENNRGVLHGQREGDWRGGNGEQHRREGGFGWAPFVFGGLAAGALVEETTARSYGQPYDGGSCYQLTPTYDQWNNYIGRRWVDVCE